jgi:hypothetical protein
MLDRHLRISQILLLVLVFLAAGKPKSYSSGRLANVSMEDVSIPFTLDKTTIPVSLGTMYKFDIASEGVNYIAACFSRRKRGFASDWTVQNTIEFRLHDDKLFLKRPSGKELRVLLLTKTQEADQGKAPPPQLHPSRQTIPECR